MKPSFFAPLSIITISFVQQQISLATNAEKVSIESVCAKTRAPDVCISVLKADPRSTNGVLRTFAVIMLEKALSVADGLKGRCPETYVKIVGDIGGAIDTLSSGGSASSAISSVLSAVNNVVSCLGGFSFLLTLLKIALDILKLIK